ncbi:MULTISPECIES: DUF6228 family protein [unclassified Streptomyces]|uniref:DUF6228 family protein n=1 Tax=unclassified Streptomyces TaxID=2593676 RepID=UPI003326E832
MIIRDARGGQLLRIGNPGQGVHLLFSTPTRPFGDDDPALDIPVQAKGAWVNVSELVQTLDGDGLVEFLTSLAGESGSWSEARSWQSSEGQLKISAQRSAGRIVLTWGMGRKVTESESSWYFETVTSHAGEQEMQGFSEGFQVLFSGESERVA